MLSVMILTRLTKNNPLKGEFLLEQAKVCQKHIEEDPNLRHNGLCANCISKKANNRELLEVLKKSEGVVISDPEVLSDDIRDQCLVEKYLELHKTEVICV